MSCHPFGLSGREWQRYLRLRRIEQAEWNVYGGRPFASMRRAYRRRVIARRHRR